MYMLKKISVVTILAVVAVVAQTASATTTDNVLALYNYPGNSALDTVYEYDGTTAGYTGVTTGAFGPDAYQVAGLGNGNFAVSFGNLGVGVYSGATGAYVSSFYAGFGINNMTGLTNGNLATLYDGGAADQIVFYNPGTGASPGQFALGVSARDVAGLSNGKFAVSFDGTGGDQIAVYNNDGSFTGTQFAPGFAVNKMTGLSNGNIAVVYNDGYLGMSSQVVIYNSTGGYVTQFATGTNVLDIAGLQNGRFAVSYEFYGTYGMSLFTNAGAYTGLTIGHGFEAPQIAGFAVPEPATMAVLSLGGLIFRLRRGRSA